MLNWQLLQAEQRRYELWHRSVKDFKVRVHSKLKFFTVNFYGWPGQNKQLPESVENSVHSKISFLLHWLLYIDEKPNRHQGNGRLSQEFGIREERPTFYCCWEPTWYQRSNCPIFYTCSTLQSSKAKWTSTNNDAAVAKLSQIFYLPCLLYVIRVISNAFVGVLMPRILTAYVR